jgi:probable phosphoglycerate mutase
MPVLYFIRHGETDWNREGRLQGQTETSLNARGRRQAAIAGAHLSAVAAADGVADLAALPFHASPMARTRETIEIIRAGLGLPPDGYATDTRLKEIRFGAWEGRRWADIRDREPGRARARNRDRWCFEPPDGESYAAMLDRVSAWLGSVREDLCVVAHGGTARVLMVALAGVPPEEAAHREIWQGKVLRLSAQGAEWLPDPGHA